MASTPRRPSSAKEKAEALFKAATTKPDAPKAKANAIPVGKEMVSIRIDRDVLAHFQDDGIGWQDRINAALRKAAGLS
ncbi:BrnA antitoxin family protein [Pelagibacterium mangrovi]|uniref:BrnA antitoxin family protein n=1 Tax=Pelagibacterium mangrovi TaxID=3119828 RepID=UPI002FC629AA